MRRNYGDLCDKLGFSISYRRAARIKEASRTT
jgi:hypothetical protein